MNKSNNKGAGLIFLGVIFCCTVFLFPLGVIMIITGVTKNIEGTNNSYNANNIYKQKNIEYTGEVVTKTANDDESVFTPQPDFEDLTKDDVAQDSIHKHDGWENNDGPIKYS